MLQALDERNRDVIVNVGGRLTHRDEAAVSPFDSAVQGGDAVWEGLRLYRGRIFRLTEHLGRLRRSAKALAFDTVPSDEEITEQVRRTLHANQMTDNVHIRLTLTRGEKVTSGMDPRLNRSGPTLIVLAEHKPPVYDLAGITLILVVVYLVTTEQNRRVQAEVNQRQQFINQSIQFGRVNEALIRALAGAAVGDKDDKLRDLLAQNGIAINPQTGAPVPAAPTGVEKPGAAPPAPTEKKP